MAGKLRAESSAEVVMKGRLGSTIWLLVGFNCIALLGVLALAFAAGSKSGGRLPILDYTSGAVGLEFVAAAFLILLVTVILGWTLNGRVLKPVKELTQFSE